MSPLFHQLRAHLDDLTNHTLKAWKARHSSYQDILLIKKFNALGLQPFEYTFKPVSDCEELDVDLIFTSILNFNEAIKDNSLVLENKSDIRLNLCELGDTISSLKILNCKNISIEGNPNSILSCQCIFDNSSSVLISSTTFAESSFLNFSNCSGVSVKDCSFLSSTKASLVFLRCSNIFLDTLRFKSCNFCSIFIGASCSNYTISNSSFTNGRGKSNWHAPIVISARSLISLDNDLSGLLLDGYWGKPENISKMINPPRKGYIINNFISQSTSSGVYLDGAVELILESNIIEHCSKEGICLDYGCLNVAVACNKIIACGERSQKSDEDLARDFVLQFGRCNNGSARAKLPGISIDNSGFCYIFSNQITLNYGSGIKTVRTGIGNIIVENSFLSNNQGHNDTFHFFGIEFGSAPGDVEASDINFIGTCLNVIARNIISNKHYSALFIPPDCFHNLVCDNIMLKPLFFSIESIEVNKTNQFLNNFSQSDTKNCSLSLVRPAYAGIGNAIYD